MSSTYETFRRDREVLYVVSAADCVCDRLAKFYYWNDTDSFRTAADIALVANVDLEYVRKWSEEEGELQKFEEFRKYFRRLQQR